jgi:hypothetical protein
MSGEFRRTLLAKGYLATPSDVNGEKAPIVRIELYHGGNVVPVPLDFDSVLGAGGLRIGKLCLPPERAL